MNRRVFWFILLDILFILAGFWISAELKHSSFSTYFFSYHKGLALFGIIWILLSLLFNKYEFKKDAITSNTKQVLISNLSILAVSTILIYFLRTDNYSRFIVLGTVSFTTMIEIIFFNLWVILKKTNVLSDDFLIPQKKKGKKKERSYQISEPIIVDEKRKQSIRREILHELGKTSYCYFEKVVTCSPKQRLFFQQLRGLTFRINATIFIMLS